MGKRSFWRDEDARKKRRERRLESGYVSRAYHEEDVKRGRHDRVDDTKELHRKNVALYTEFLIEEGYEPPGYELTSDSPLPDIACTKDFIRWYIGSSAGRGRLSKNRKPTARSATAFAERFFGGFEEATTKTIVEEDRTEIYAWIRKTLTANKVIEDVKKQKFNFTRDDFRNTVSSMWTRDSPIFMHGLLKIFILFALQVYLFTGARIGAFIPEHKHKHQRGLRYRHIELVLFRSANEPWKVGWRINQQWLKKNRDENYTVFGIGIRDHNRPQFATGILLLVIALADGALFGIESVEDLAEFDLRDSGRPAQIKLEWKQTAKNKPVFRNVTAKGPQGVALTKERFCYFLRQILIMAGYSKSATIHDIRRALGKKIEGRHGSAPVSQIYAHKSAGTYPEHYQAHCSSIDTVGDVLDEDEETYHIDYFQGYEQFREVGLPRELPAAEEEAILHQPELVAIRDRIERLLAEKASSVDVEFERKEYRKAHVRIRLSEMHRYQTQWVQERRDWRIISRGKVAQESLESNTRNHTLALIMPELGCIAETLSSAEPLSFDEKLLFARQLLTQCRRDYDVVYLRDEAPINGRCPATACREDVQKLQKRERSPHIHNCMRKDMAQRLGVDGLELRYCYECMNWLQIKEWPGHCGQHLRSWDNLHCETILYRHTVIRPGYCPCCLWNQTLPAEERLEYWLNSAGLRNHLEKKHMPKIKWPTTGPICGCSKSFESEHQFRYHLHDVHGLADGIWKLCAKRKRAAKPACSDETVEESKPKKIRFQHYQPPHQHLQATNSPGWPTTAQTFALPQTQTSPLPWDYACPSSHFGSDATGDSITETSTDDASASTSPLSSLCTTPDIELIDPRILGPLWAGNGDPPPIDGTRRASDLVVCADHCNAGIAQEETTDDSTIIQFDALHIDDHQIGHEESGATADTTPPNTSAARADVGSASTDVGSRDELPGCSSKSSVQSASFTKYACQTLSSKGPVTRARARATQTEVADKSRRTRQQLFTPTERRTLQALKGQNLGWDEVKSYFPEKAVDSLRRAWENTQQLSARRCTRSQAKMTRPPS